MTVLPTRLTEVGLATRSNRPHGRTDGLDGPTKNPITTATILQLSDAHARVQDFNKGGSA